MIQLEMVFFQQEVLHCVLFLRSKSLCVPADTWSSGETQVSTFTTLGRTVVFVRLVPAVGLSVTHVVVEDTL